MKRFRAKLRYLNLQQASFWSCTLAALLLFGGCAPEGAPAVSEENSSKTASPTAQSSSDEFGAIKASLDKINIAINAGDFSTATPWMTQRGADEIASWVVGFALILTDPEASANYPQEFNDIQDALKPMVQQYDLAIDLKAFKSTEETALAIKTALDKSDDSWAVINQLWTVAKDSPLEMVLIRGAVNKSKSAISQDEAFLQIARQAPGVNKKYDAGAPPSVARFVNEGSVWKFDGLDTEKTKTAETAHQRKMATMPPTVADPNFEATSVTGDKVSYADYAGKVLIIDFWGTWCGPCVENLPKLAKIQKAFQPHGLEVVGVALDEQEDLEDFLKKSPLPWVNIPDNGDLKDQFAVKAFPTLFIIDQQKQHVASNLDAQELIDKIIELLDLPAADYAGLKKEIAAIKGGH